MPGFTNHSPAQMVPQTRASGHKSISFHRVAVPMMFERIFMDIASERRKAAQDPSRAAHANNKN